MMNIGPSNQEKLRNIQEFEAEAREEVLKYIPNSLPFVASVLKVGTSVNSPVICRLFFLFRSA